MTEDDAIQAGELALDLLDGEEKAAALRRVVAEPAFAREVERWRRRFATLHEQAPNIDPGVVTERRVLFIPDANHGVDKRWRWLAAASSAVAASLLAVLLVRPAAVAPPPSPAATPVLIAVLKPEQGKPFGAFYDAATREVRLTGTVPIPAGKDAELWAIGADGKPHAAGLLRQGRAVRVLITSDLTIGAGLTLAISVEPAGGSPKSTPTGPVVATGELVEI